MAVCAVSAKSSRRLAWLGGASSPAGQRYLDDLVPLAVYSSVAVCAASVERARRPDRGAADLGSDDESASESSGPLPSPPPPSQRPPLGVGGPPPPPPLEEAASRPVAAAAPIPLVGVSEIVWPSQSVEGASTSFRDERQAEPLQEQGPSAPSAEQALAPPDLAQLFAAAAAQLSGASQSQAPFGAVCRCDGAWSGGLVSWAS